MTGPILDLLRERREELGQPSLLPVLAKRTSTLRLGAGIGGALVVLAGVATVMAWLSNQYVRSQMANLERVEGEVSVLRTRLEGRNGEIAKLVATNRELARSLTTVRASSALLSELQLRTPDGIQLLSAREQGSILVIKGRAADPAAFTRINALQLEMQESPLLKAREVSLKKLERDQQQADRKRAGGDTAPAIEPPTPPVDFELTGTFADLSPDQLLRVLQTHRSSGFASRLQLLRQEGLMP